MKRYLLKKSILSVCFVVFSFGLIISTFPMMDMKIVPTYFSVDLFYAIAFAILTFALPLIAQWIVQLILLIVEFAILISSVSLYMSRGDVFNWSLLTQVGQLEDVSEMIKIPKISIFFGLSFIIGFILIIVLIRVKEKIKLKNFYSWITSLVLALCLILSSVGNVLVHNKIKNNYKENLYYTSDSFMYNSFVSSYASLQKFGFYGYYLEDAFRRIFPATKPKEKDISQLYSYEYHSSVLNNLCPDNNVVMIYAESFDMFGITQELTPILYSMKKGANLNINGIKDFYNVEKNNNETTISRKDFDFNESKYVYNNTKLFENINYNEVGLELSNYYSKEATNVSEHKALSGNWHSINDGSYTIPKLLDSHKSTYIHGNWANFYERKDRMDSLVGFDNTIFLEDMKSLHPDNAGMSENLLNVRSFDSLTLKHYTDHNSEYNYFPTDEKFLTFFMTVTTHGPYHDIPLLKDNYLLVDAVIETYSSSEEFKLFNSLDNELKTVVREYYARVLDTEYALAYLINYLFENDILDKTIITFTGDHNAYSDNIIDYKKLYLKEVLNKDPNLYTNIVEGFIYSTQIKNSYLSESNENRVVTHPTESVDLIPTILTLLGEDYSQDKFMGNVVINKSISDPTKTVYNKVFRSYFYGTMENEFIESSDGSTFRIKSKAHTPSQKEIDSFKFEYNNFFLKYYYVQLKRSSN